jgi:hypothetical protein
LGIERKRGFGPAWSVARHLWIRKLIVNELDFYSQASMHRVLQKQFEEQISLGF